MSKEDLRARLEAWADARANKLVEPIHSAWAGNENIMCKEGLHQMLDLLWDVVKASKDLSADWPQVYEGMQLPDSYKPLLSAFAALEQKLGGSGE